MAKKLSVDQVREVLTSGQFKDFIGILEDETLEFKAVPYQLNDDRAKQELAKDVTALANVGGGMILVGIRTEKDLAHLGDEVKEIRPFAQNIANIEQYYD